MKTTPKPSSIRLGQHELRLLMRALNANRKPILGVWFGAATSLIALGLLKWVPFRIPAERAKLREHAWKQIRSASCARNLNDCSAALRLLQDLARNESGVILTKRGEEVARAIGIRKG